MRDQQISGAFKGGSQAVVAHGQSGPTRTLVIGIDAIPYTLVRRLVDEEGLFSGLRGPAAVNSTFPSISDTAWATLLGPLGSDHPRGYEARYFDQTDHKRKGGWALTETPASWKDTFDWKLHGLVRMAFSYGFARRYALRELTQGLQAFLRSNASLFSIYILSTDGLAHLRGPRGLANALREIDAKLKAFKRDQRSAPFNTVLLSDHGVTGGKPLINCWPAVKTAARRAGFRPRRRLVDANDAVFCPYGLITNFVAYAQPGQAPRLAAALARSQGVDITAARTGDDSWRVYSKRGAALIERHVDASGTRWRYTPEEGDPLGYRGVITGLRARPGHSQAQWFADDWWFNGTRESYYPDALHRIAQGFELTDTPPAVMGSCAPGYLYGCRKTEWISRGTVGRLKWSHGALDREASLGFMMSDIPGWAGPPMLRAEEALDCLGADQVEGSTQKLEKTSS